MGTTIAEVRRIRRSGGQEVNWLSPDLFDLLASA
jgi:hypothetical protein